MKRVLLASLLLLSGFTPLATAVEPKITFSIIQNQLVLSLEFIETVTVEVDQAGRFAVLIQLTDKGHKMLREYLKKHQGKKLSLSLQNLILADSIPIRSGGDFRLKEFYISANSKEEAENIVKILTNNHNKQ